MATALVIKPRNQKLIRFMKTRLERTTKLKICICIAVTSVSGLYVHVPYLYIKVLPNIFCLKTISHVLDISVHIFYL